MKHKAFFLIVLSLLLCSGLIFPKSNPWGELKKIHFYNSINDLDRVLTHLDSFTLDNVKRSEQKILAKRLIEFGDSYLKKKQFKHAKAFYRKAMSLSSDYWYLYNKLDKIDREKGAHIFSFSNLFGQWVMMLKNFRASFLLLNHTFNLLFFAGMFVFFIFGGIIFIKYFRLVGNDLIIDAHSHISPLKILLVSVIILWPVFMVGGWMIYPFLFCGYLWFYLNDNEKKAVKYMMIVVAGLSAVFCLNLLLETNYRDARFKKVEKVYQGHLFDKKDYNGFDDHLKTVQAYSYYENQQYDTALDILNATSESHKSVLKFITMGNIFYKYGEIDQSNKYFIEALRLDSNHPVALNNFTLSLLKDQNPQAFLEYAKRFPAIKELRVKELVLKVVQPRQGELWTRLFSSSNASFNLVRFFKELLTQMLKFPVFYFAILFILYVILIRKISPHLGESTYCSKCAKIIKEASVHRSYKLCDECYQLFSIKDVIFLEAKILKEKELKKKFKGHYILSLMLSLLIPGLNMNQRENNRLFLVFSTIIYFLFGFTLVGVINFNRGFSSTPLFFNLIGVLAVLVYFFVNLFSVLGDEDGF